MSNIFVDQLNFEFEESPVYADILVNSATGSQVLSEQTTTVGYIYVNQVNLEIPAVDVVTPQPEESVGGGVGQVIEVLGGRPWSEEDIFVSAKSEQLIGEEIFVGEILEIYAYNAPDMDTRIRRPVYARPRAVEIRSFVPSTERKIIIPVETPLEEPKINSRQKEEEELLLLGII